ncbi:hypothetical protein CNMCM6805_005790 [Aspergillus fumigatiaffinis]|uniref:Uncharacterized protein n=1 Tax=Aspergillus fumigatiaffinis TaxID=340414 RepID=A0A8H4GPM7_9EURO|nr:hypothetical protein CNMCM6805_005790 [Aspergillus fumigatiaffinis]
MPSHNRRNPPRRRSGRQSLRQSDDSDSSDEGNRSRTTALDEASEPDYDTFQENLKGHAAKTNVRAVLERLAPSRNRQASEIMDCFASLFIKLVAGFKLVLDRMPPKYSDRILLELREQWHSDPQLFLLLTEENLFESAMPQHGAVATRGEGIPAPVAPARTSAKRPASSDVRTENPDGKTRRGEEKERRARLRGKDAGIAGAGRETLATSTLPSDTLGRSSTRDVQRPVPRIAPVTRQMNAPVQPNPATLTTAPSAEPLTGPPPALMPNPQASVAPYQTGTAPNRPAAHAMAPPVPPATLDRITGLLQMLADRLPPLTGTGHLPTRPPATSGVPSTVPQLPEQPPVEQIVAPVPGDIYASGASQLPQGSDPEGWMSFMMDDGHLGSLGFDPDADL